LKRIQDDDSKWPTLAPFSEGQDSPLPFFPLPLILPLPFHVSGAGATGVSNATITIEGVAVTVPLSNAGAINPSINAWEIAAESYATINDVGWNAFAESNKAVFIRKKTGPISSSTFTFSHATATGTFAQTVAGENATILKIGQSEFNFDKLDGTGPSGMIFDPTKGNVFQIDFQYLGFGKIDFSIEAEDGQFITFHEIKYNNKNIVPSLSNPSVSWVMNAYNHSGGSSNSVFIKSASAALYTQGERVYPAISYAKVSSKSNLNAARVPVLSIRHSQLYNGRLFLGETILKSISLGINASKPVNVELVINGTLNNTANFTPIGGDSVMLVDTSATSISGGYTYDAFTLSKDGEIIRDFTSAAAGEKIIGRFDTISLVLTPGAGNTEAYTSMSWFEDL
jgi:hypothetical protein